MKEAPVKVLFTGDFCPVYRIEKLAIDQNFDSVLNDFINVFRGNDLNVVDLECPLTTSESARPKTGPHQKAHPDCVNILKYAGVNLVAMANNHIMDYDAGGVNETLKLCTDNGIATVGIGHSDEYPTEPFVMNAGGKSIAIFNYADNEFLSTTDGTLQCNRLDPVRCFYDIRDARDKNDYIIVVAHSGNEFYDLPSPRTKKLYRYIIDSGADALISHHTHAFSGYEIYNSKPIFYGLGNFIYDRPGITNTKWNQGFVVRLFLGDRIDFEIIPLKQCTEQPGVFHLTAQDKEIFNNEIDRLNSIISDEEQLEANFRNYCERVYPMYDAFIEPYFGKYITALQRRHFLPKLLTKRKRLLLLNLIRCESHREVIVRMLKRYE